MSCTDGFIGTEPYEETESYPLYNQEYYRKDLFRKLQIDKFPTQFTLSLIQIHNLIITSSVCFERQLLDTIGYMKLIRNGGEIINGTRDWQDWNYWRRMLHHTNCLYLTTPFFYYRLRI